MQYISKENIDRYFGDKPMMELKSFLACIENDYGVSAPIQSITWSNLNEEQASRMTKAISENEDIRAQIRIARSKRDPQHTVYIRNKGEFNKLLDEARNGK